MTWRTHSLTIAPLAVASAALVVLTSCGTGSLSADPSRTDQAQQGLPDVSSHTVPGHCQGRLGDVSVDGDVTVPNGATCELIGTTVEGNVSVGRGARLYARGVHIDGDIEGENTAVVDLSAGSDIGGNLQLESGGTATVRDSHVDGDLAWEGQHGDLLAKGSIVRGNVELDGNTGGLSLSDNRVGGDLSCQDNASAPGGGGNTVSGDQDDQCRGL